MHHKPMVLLDERKIGEKVEELAHRISCDYAGKELILVCILKGAFTFAADLMRLITIPTSVEFIQASSYGSSFTSTGIVTIKRDVEVDCKGKHVLIIDTVIDSGRTMECVVDNFRRHNPASLATVVLLNKKSRRIMNIQTTYCGFDIPDIFIVGVARAHERPHGRRLTLGTS